MLYKHRTKKPSQKELRAQVSDVKQGVTASYKEITQQLELRVSSFIFHLPFNSSHTALQQMPHLVFDNAETFQVLLDFLHAVMNDKLVSYVSV